MERKIGKVTRKIRKIGTTDFFYMGFLYDFDFQVKPGRKTSKI